jgi:hypothetical protein
MSTLNTEPNFGHAGHRPRYAHEPGDDFYAQLLQAHEGLTAAQSELLNARLVLLLANHVGDLDVLARALEAARRGVQGGARDDDDRTSP